MGSELLYPPLGAKDKQLSFIQGKISIVQAVAASLVVQDITFTSVLDGVVGNGYSIEYQDTATAGAETVSVVDGVVVVGIESGVSTATQVKAALDAESTFTDIMTATITGTAGTAQVTAAATSLAGGIDGVSKFNMLGVASVVKDSATADGLYKITLNSKWPKLIAAQCTVMGANIVTQQIQFKSQAVSSDKTIYIQYSASGTAANPTVAHDLHVSIVMSRSSLNPDA